MIDFIDARLKNGFEIEEDLYELLMEVNRQRARMSTLKQSFLSETEDYSDHDMRVFMLDRVRLKPRSKK